MIGPLSLATASLTPPDILDLVVAAAVFVGALVGLLRGLSGELARLAAILVSGLVCWGVSGPWRTFCAAQFPASSLTAGCATVAGVLAVCVLAGWAVRRLVDKGLRILVPQPANAILGLVLGGLCLFLLASALCYLLHLLPFEAVREKLLAPSRIWGIDSALFGWK